MATPVAGDQAPRLGNLLTRAVGRGLLALLGWRVEGELPNLPKFVAIGAPHRSYFDVVIGLSVVVACGIRINWMAKHTAFKPPFGALIKRLGGVPINRTANFNAVEQMVQKLQNAQRLVLVVMPEGSRKRAGVPVTEWKTGFYYIALGAQAPIFPVAIDNLRKRVIFGPHLTPTGDKEVDFAQLQRFYTHALKD